MEPVKVVVVGCGGMAKRWVDLSNTSPGIELVGLVDLVRANAEKMAERFELRQSLVFDSLPEAVKATGAEAVFDVTVPAAHAAVTLEALSLGCHVLGEKPMSDNLADAQRMVAAAEQAGKLYAVTQTRRPLSQFVSATQFLQGGELGTLEELHSDFYLGCHFGGFRDEMDYPLILDMAIHTFDNARQLSAADPVSVYCHTWNPAHSWSKGDMNACAIFEMQDAAGRPLVYTYRGSWVNEGGHTKWECDWRCVGSKGTLLWDGGAQFKAQRVKDGGDHGFHSEMEDLHLPQVELERTGHEYLIHDFIDAVRSDGAKLPMCHCKDNIKSLAMVMAAVESAKSGQKVAVTW